jgi:hypothetical protein
MVFGMVFGAQYLQGQAFFVFAIAIYILPLFIYPLIEKLSFPLAVFGEILFKFRILDTGGVMNMEHHSKIQLPYNLIRGYSVEPDYQVLNERLITAVEPAIRNDLIEFMEVSAGEENIFHLCFEPPYEFINEEGDLEAFDELFVKTPGDIQTLDELFRRSPDEFFAFSPSVRGYATGYFAALRVADTYRGIPICVNLMTFNKAVRVEKEDKFRVDEYKASFWRNKCTGLEQQLMESEKARKEVLEQGVGLAQMVEHIRSLMHSTAVTNKQKSYAIMVVIGIAILCVALGQGHFIILPFIPTGKDPAPAPDNSTGAFIFKEIFRRITGVGL